MTTERAPLQRWKVRLRPTACPATLAAFAAVWTGGMNAPFVMDANDVWITVEAPRWFQARDAATQLLGCERSEIDVEEAGT